MPALHCRNGSTSGSGASAAGELIFAQSLDASSTATEAAAAAAQQQQQQQQQRRHPHEQLFIAAWKPQAGATAAAIGTLTSAACDEGSPAAASGRFNATCTHRYAAALHGFAAHFALPHLALFVEAYADQLLSVAADSRVSLRGGGGGGGVEAVGGASAAQSEWGLDRLDQAALPLDGDYRYWNQGSGVNAYIVDTVGMGVGGGVCVGGEVSSRSKGMGVGLWGAATKHLLGLPPLQGIRATHREFRRSSGQPGGSRASEVYAPPDLEGAGGLNEGE